ncbi:MAG: type III-A CRISPR-associated RAMP protein Csm5 [Chitinophagaceae bacterium]|nr:type III-A CRISPR-associated RAMP protein Csm5 [Chitinophagaceae bacterium]
MAESQNLSKMLRATLTTLTPVHVGSGVILNKDIDFFIKDNSIYFIDDEKMLQAIGTENLNQWADALLSGSTLSNFLNRIGGPRMLNHPEALSAYSAELKTGSPSASQLKTHYRTAMQGPAIPGSSLKGAISTLLIKNYLKPEEQNETDILLVRRDKEDNVFLRNNEYIPIYDRNGKLQFKDNQIQKKVFGKNPNESINRFVKIYDVVFPEVSTEIYEIRILNLVDFKRKIWELKGRESLLIECIPAGCKAEFSFKLDTEWFLKNINKGVIPRNANQVPHLTNKKNFFSILNGSMKQIIESDLKELDTNAPGNNEIFEKFYEKLYSIYDHINECESHECILRVGGHVGWTYTTGEWVRHTSPEKISDEVFEELRKQIQKKVYPQNSMWPKTRKTTLNGDVFGFVKISVKEQIS